MDNEKPDKSVKPGKRLAVLETADHADEVIAQAAGQDRLEHPLATPSSGIGQPATAFARTGFAAGHHWEALRPLEALDAARPVIAYSEKWRQQRGRFGALKGFGRAVQVLLARRSY